MTNHSLAGIQSQYDVVVIGSGLAGLTGANCLAKLGHRVLLLEHHYQLGGLATYFKRPGGHIFDISLHGFPHGMIKSCRKYWSREIADAIRQLKDVRFLNPEFQIQTTFDRQDFTRILNETFKVPASQVEAFFEHLRQMNYYDNDTRTTRELFEEFFPGRTDIHRLLIEPIAYANGSTMDDPAITFGIVFSNFMSKGVFIFQGGTDVLIAKMTAELKANGVDIQRNCLVEKVYLEKDPDGRPHVRGLRVRSRRDGSEREIACKAVLSNANIKNTILNLVGEENIPASFATETKAVRVNTSSAQVYMGIREGDSIPHIGDLVFTSGAQKFSSQELIDLNTTSRTYSVYYPDTRPHTKAPRYAIVTSINQQWDKWNSMNAEDYAANKTRLIEESFMGLEKYIPDIRKKVDWVEAATPRTVERYVKHWEGASFGTKFEGLKVSMELPDHVAGLYHAGSVGIIMSGWLGTINYGVIVSAKIDAFLRGHGQTFPVG
ncbi:MAG: NAD(P)/FAD-dependent oxidoreductase [Puniceicoccales bacterium]|jgi:phytoene dehydrogenase-like protein|nr:NAD(P)/FAD-dependent oxidoreductase [Puniceicoccales bacterium]